ncbi:MAG TPA: hypothetical protein VFX47_02950 [Gammaproteobacteria bacterium]|nr:hypothetical protein [Gammaproteobacteria bacterium]
MAGGYSASGESHLNAQTGPVMVGGLSFGPITVAAGGSNATSGLTGRALVGLAAGAGVLIVSLLFAFRKH